MRSDEVPVQDKLVWKQPRVFRRVFELRRGETLVGTLAWEGFFSRRAVGTLGGGRWIFERQGFFRRQMVAFDASTGSEVAWFQFDWRNGGRLTVRGERSYEWKRTALLRDRWVLLDANGFTVFRQWMRLGFFRYGAEVYPEVDAEKLADLPLLLLMGWAIAYVVVQERAAVVAAS